PLASGRGEPPTRQNAASPGSEDGVSVLASGVRCVFETQTGSVISLTPLSIGTGEVPHDPSSKSFFPTGGKARQLQPHKPGQPPREPPHASGHGQSARPVQPADPGPQREPARG